MNSTPPTLPTPRWQTLWNRWKHLVAAASFALGVGSFLLFDRQERMAKLLVILLPISLLLALMEPWLQRMAERRRLLRASPLLLGYVSQAMHQECLFFTLPFFLATASLMSPQAAFTAVMGLLAVLSITDPIYYRRIVPRRAALWGFHAVAGFVTVLTAAPMLWHVTTTQSLWLALACAGAISIPAWHSLLPLPRGLLRTVLAISLGVSVTWLGWQVRVAIPPATLRVTEMAMTTAVDVSGRRRGEAFETIGADTLREQGAYAWSAIRVPRGLRERVEHHWIHEGRRVDVIGLDIRGGREAGYRAWSHKRAFPADPRGNWTVRVVTQSGQLIGQTRFEVR